MRRLTIRHLDHDDIDDRVNLLMEAAFSTNLAHIGALNSREELRRLHERSIEQAYESKIFFVVATPQGTTVGYTWISDIDWRHRVCELSIALLPQFRRAYGLLTLIEMYEYLYDEMNFETVVNQILVGNEMLMSDGAAERTRQVYCPRDSFTEGAFRDSRYWSQTREQHRAFTARARQRNERVRARIARHASERSAA